MKKFKTAICIALCAAAVFSFAGCSVIDSVTSPDVSESSQTNDGSKSKPAAKTVDSSIPVPVFTAGLPEGTTIAVGSTLTLDGTAVSEDGGEVTYQWYSNNVASNGGGTAIEGATEATYTVDSSNAGTTYYYVVASNNHDSSYSMAISNISLVDVIQSGEWVAGEDGGVKYIASDGSYPVDRWVVIGTDTYYFDVNGNRVTGWINDNTLYFDEEGRYVPGAVYEAPVVETPAESTDAAPAENTEGTTEAAQ